MSNPENHVRIKLTADQQEMIKKGTGKEVEVLELSVTELEQRIAPALYAYLNLPGQKTG